MRQNYRTPEMALIYTTKGHQMTFNSEQTHAVKSCINGPNMTKCDTTPTKNQICLYSIIIMHNILYFSKKGRNQNR